jgi:carboxyl-terminal processing protease
MKIKKLLVRLASLLLVAAMTLSAASCVYSGGTKDDKYEKLDLIDQLFRTYTLFELDEEALMDAVLKGYIEGTGDKYAEYFTEEEYKLFNSENRGELVGIGISIIHNADRGLVEIINVFPDSPALEAGLMPGDLITYIGTGENRQSVYELGYTNATEIMRGEAGSVAEITVERGGEEIEFSIIRKKITAYSVLSRVCTVDKSVGIVKITGFDLTTPKQFTAAVDELLAKGCDKFVFDVRYNPGGDLRSIRAVLSYFLDEGDVFIRTSDKSGNAESQIIEPVEYSSAYSDYNVTKEEIGKYRDLEFAVLVNGSTASAAELFTSALMDHGLSVTVGTNTYGKGTMQTTFSLARYGYSGALKLTTQYYYPPISDSYDGTGISPDVEEEPDEALAEKNIYKITDEEDNQLLSAITELYKK